MVFAWTRAWCLPLMAGVCLTMLPGASTAQISDPGRFLEQTEKLRIKDHRQFRQRLQDLHRQSPVLTPRQQWQLRYLDGFELTLEGRFAAADPMLRDVIEHSGDVTLAAKASATLLSNLAVTHRYQDAFTLAHQLTNALPTIRDPVARLSVLGNLSQMLNLAGQTDLAIEYAHMMIAAVPAGMSECDPRFKLMAALYSAKRLKSSSPELARTAELCDAAGQPIIAVATELIITTLLLEEKQPARALALLDRLAPRVQRNAYYPHRLSAQEQRAEAYDQLGQHEAARKAALAVVAMAEPGSIDNYIRDAYRLLYRLAQQRGDAAAALSYYRHYATQDKSYLDDVAAQALAYQTVQQHVLTRELETAALGKQNRILKLQRALDAKASETSRLYIAMLIVLLLAIVLWLSRTMRSQRRFQRMASRDGLTGILNHQHFVSEAERILLALEKKRSEACLISIDLDHFKRINDTHGHAMGDAVLRRAVATCQQHLRPTDVFGRLGGEEFGVLLPDCSPRKGLAIAERMREAIHAMPVRQGETTLPVSASMGVTSTHASGYALQMLCADADAALYRAKREGRNRVVGGMDDTA